MALSVGSNLDLQSVNKVVNAAQANAAGQYVEYAQWTAQIEGLAWKDDVRVAAPGNVNLAAPGANIDALAMSNGDRFFAGNQTTGSEIGIYIFNGAAVAATRALDMNASAEFNAAIFTVDSGSSAGVSYRITTVNPTLGTTTIAYTTAFSNAPAASTGTAGVAALATQAEVNAGAVTNKIVTPQTLNGTNFIPKLIPVVIGDGTSTSFTVTHNMNTRTLLAEVVRNSGNYDRWFVEVDRTTLNAVTVKFDGYIPASNEFTVIIAAVNLN